MLITRLVDINNRTELVQCNGSMATLRMLGEAMDPRPRLVPFQGPIQTHNNVFRTVVGTTQGDPPQCKARRHLGRVRKQHLLHNDRVPKHQTSLDHKLLQWEGINLMTVSVTQIITQEVHPCRFGTEILSLLDLVARWGIMRQGVRRRHVQGRLHLIQELHQK